MALPARPLAPWLLACVGLASVGCDSCAKPAADGVTADAAEPAASAVSTGPAEPEPDPDASAAEIGKRFRDAAPKIDPDAEAPVDAACSGAELSFEKVVADLRCAIPSSKAKELRAGLDRDGGRLPLEQQARVVDGGDGGERRVEVRLVNRGTETLVLPLSHHSKLPAFTALAEEPKRALYELEAPRLELAAPAGDAGRDRPRFARIALPPGGAATATVVVSAKVTRRLDPPCEAGTCAPAELPKGKYVLHLGQLVSDVEAGAPARVEWELR